MGADEQGSSLVFQFIFSTRVGLTADPVIRDSLISTATQSPKPFPPIKTDSSINETFYNNIASFCYPNFIGKKFH